MEEESVKNVLASFEYLKASGRLSLISIQVVPSTLLEDVKYFKNYKIVLSEVIKIKRDESNIIKRLINKLLSREYFDKEVIYERTVPAFIQDLEEEKKVTECSVESEKSIFNIKYYTNSNTYDNIVVILRENKDSWSTVIKLPSLVVTLMDKSTGFIEKQVHYFEKEEEMNKVVDFIIEEDNIYCIEKKKKSSLDGIKDEIKDVYINFKNLCKDGK